MKVRRRALRLRRGVYLLPSVLTIGNIFCGFWAIVSVFGGRFERASWLIVIAILLDGLDGRVARLTQSTSRFGEQFDSLADVISFGLAPAMLAYAWGLHGLDRIGWLSCFLFVIGGAARLARFNIQTGTQDRRFFVGLPIPAAALLVAALVLFHDGAPVREKLVSISVLALVVVTAFLMVSTLRYWSFKDLDVRRRYPFWSVLIPALLLFLVFSHPQVMLVSIAAAYALSGPIGRLVGWARQRGRQRSAAPIAPPT